jgi:hypothetical protein
MDIILRPLRSIYFGAPSLMTGRVCNYQGSLSSVKASQDSKPYISASFETQVRVFISSRYRVAQLYPQALDSLFVASYDSYGHGILSRMYPVFRDLSFLIILCEENKL